MECVGLDGKVARVRLKLLVALLNLLQPGKEDKDRPVVAVLDDMLDEVLYQLVVDELFVDGKKNDC